MPRASGYFKAGRECERRSLPTRHQQSHRFLGSEKGATGLLLWLQTAAQGLSHEASHTTPPFAGSHQHLQAMSLPQEKAAFVVFKNKIFNLEKCKAI